MTLRPYFEPGLRQLRRLWLPFAIIQLLGLAVVVSYFTVPAMARTFATLGDVKARGGVPFNAAALAIACGVMPELFKFATGVDRSLGRGRLTFTLHNVVIFAVIGVVQGLFYDLLNRLFGDHRSAAVVVAKTAIDQFVYSAFLTVPFVCFSFTLRTEHYDLRAAARRLDRRWYATEVLPTLLVNWAYWWPMALLMYTLPPRLTFVFSVLAGAAGATLMTAVASQTAKEERLQENVPAGR